MKGTHAIGILLVEYVMIPYTELPQEDIQLGISDSRQKHSRCEEHDPRH